MKIVKVLDMEVEKELNKTQSNHCKRRSNSYRSEVDQNSITKQPLETCLGLMMPPSVNRDLSPLFTCVCEEGLGMLLRYLHTCIHKHSEFNTIEWNRKECLYC